MPPACLSRRNLLRLLLFWGTGIVLVAVHAGLSGRLESEAVPLQDQVPVSERGETGAMTAWRKDSPSGTEPACKIVFDNLRAENGNLGVLSTASLKIVYVDNLQAAFFVGDSADASSANPLGLFDEDESIIVPGRYSLQCDGTVRMGLGDRFSKALKPADGDSSDTEGDQGWADGFQFGSF